MWRSLTVTDDGCEDSGKEKYCQRGLTGVNTFIIFAKAKERKTNYDKNAKLEWNNRILRLVLNKKGGHFSSS